MFHKHLIKTKKALSVILSTMLISSLIVGCDKKTETGSATTFEYGKKAIIDSTEGKVETSNERNKSNITSTTTTHEDERGEDGTRIVTDMVVRKVEIPSKVNKVFTTSPVGTIALYSINPERIAGLNNQPGEVESKYLLEDYLKLPVLGTYKEANSGNEEEILREAPDIIISMGNLDDSWISKADESQAKLGIPFLMIDGNLENLDKSYEFLGDILGEQEICKELSKYCKETIEDTKKLAKKIPVEKRKKIYYATDTGLSSNIRGSLHTQPIELIGAINVVEPTSQQSTSTRVYLSMEQVLSWNPDIIIATQSDVGSGAYETITKNSKWGSAWNNIDAVKDKNVYGIPYAPFNWFDRPPSVNRILGIRWLGNLVYPEYFKINIRKETKKFYKMFYHHELTDKELDDILKNSVKNK